jgi:hypothetical protein
MKKFLINLKKFFCENPNNKIIEHYMMINTHRRLIESKLNELNLESNDVMQKIYIDEDQRQNYINRMKMIKESFYKRVEIILTPRKSPRRSRRSPTIKLRNGRIITSRRSSISSPRRRLRTSIKSTFNELLYEYYTDPWIIKSPHINRIKNKRKNKKYKTDLKKIKEKNVKIIEI